jgi:DNA repair photolyase
MSSLDAFIAKDDCPVKVVRRECSTALSRSGLPGLDFALNPYTRCGHGCTYCYAPYIMRTSPAEWDRGIVAKINIPKVLARELVRKKGAIGLGTVTDPYQPVEAHMLLTRKCLEEMTKVSLKVSVLTKSDLVLRDVDVLKLIDSVEVGITINTISDERAGVFEKYAASPTRRLKAAATMVDKGVSTYMFLGPVIPTITDHDIEGLVDAIAKTGVRSVIVDRLNLRPGMKRRMGEVMSQRSPSTLTPFIARVDDPVFYAETIMLIRERLEHNGISVTDAF